jgi:hypothetical protein
MQLLEAQVLDQKHLELRKKIAIPRGATVFVSIVSETEDRDKLESWFKLSADGLVRVYGDKEPEYGPESLVSRNPQANKVKD